LRWIFGSDVKATTQQKSAPPINNLLDSSEIKDISLKVTLDRVKGWLSTDLKIIQIGHELTDP
jgi:hypothetical protein